MNFIVIQLLIILLSISNAYGAEFSNPISEMASLISDFGIQIVIVAIMLIFMWRHMNNIIKRDNKLFEDMTPRIADIKKAIIDMDTNLTTLVSNHNARANSEFKEITKEQEDLKEVVARNEVLLKDVLIQITILNANAEAMHRYLLNVLNNLNVNKQQEPTFNTPPTHVSPKILDDKQIKPDNDENTGK